MIIDHTGGPPPTLTFQDFKTKVFSRNKEYFEVEEVINHYLINFNILTQGNLNDDLMFDLYWAEVLTPFAAHTVDILPEIHTLWISAPGA